MKTTDSATPRPWRYEYGAAYTEKGCVLRADRDNPNTQPFERDANIQLAIRAVNRDHLFERMVEFVQGALPLLEWTDRHLEKAGETSPAALLSEARAILKEVEGEK